MTTRQYKQKKKAKKARSRQDKTENERLKATRKSGTNEA